MKILVIEDNQLHIDAAIAQLGEHDLTIFKSWREIMGYSLERGCGFSSQLIGDHEKQRKLFCEYDMVLTDINIPGTLDSDGSEPEAPIGLAIIIRMAEFGIKYIGAITDKGHHSDALTKTFDMWASYKKPFVLGGSKIMIKDSFMTYSPPKNEGEKIVWFKDWKKMYDFLTQ